MPILPQARGFLLAEAILGTLLVAVAVGLVAYTTQVLESNTAQMKRQTGAKMVARQEMERVLALPFEELDTAATGVAPIVVSVKRTLDDHEIYTAYSTSISVTPSSDGKLRQITVSTVDTDAKISPIQLHSAVYDSHW